MIDFLKKKMNIPKFATGGIIEHGKIKIVPEPGEVIVLSDDFKKLVDANKLREQFLKPECRTQTRRDFVAMLDYAESVDAVPVVRCKDCEWYQLRTTGEFDCRKTTGLMNPKPEDFCSFGRRRK